MKTGIAMSVTEELIEQLSALTCRNEGGAVLIHADQVRALLAERAEFRRLLLEQEQIMQSLRDSEWALIGEREELLRDAGRYRHYRQGMVSPELLDSNIDAAMQSEAKQ